MIELALGLVFRYETIIISELLNILEALSSWWTQTKLPELVCNVNVH